MLVHATTFASCACCIFLVDIELCPDLLVPCLLLVHAFYLCVVINHQKGGDCKENGPRPILLWILVFDDQHNQIGLTYL